MISFLSYQPSWPLDFVAVRTKILDATGDMVASVEHIGSTAVPGLCAKDIIDVQVGIHSFAIIEQLTGALEKGGFALISHVTHDHAPGHEFNEYVSGFEKRFFRSVVGRAVNVHVRLMTGKNFEFALSFRDFLRTSQDARCAYEQVKIRLAKAVGDDLESYTLIKDPICDLIWMLATKKTI